MKKINEEKKIAIHLFKYFYIYMSFFFSLFIYNSCYFFIIYDKYYLIFFFIYLFTYFILKRTNDKSVKGTKKIKRFVIQFFVTIFFVLVFLFTINDILNNKRVYSLSTYKSYIKDKLLFKSNINDLNIDELLKNKNIILIQDDFKEKKIYSDIEFIDNNKYKNKNKIIKTSHGNLLYKTILKNKNIKKEQILKLQLFNLEKKDDILLQNLDFFIVDNKIYSIIDLIDKINNDKIKHNILLNKSFVSKDVYSYIKINKYLLNKYKNLIISGAFVNFSNDNEEKVNVIKMLNNNKPFDRFYIGCDPKIEDNDLNKIKNNWKIKRIFISSSLSTILYGIEELNKLK